MPYPWSFRFAVARHAPFALLVAALAAFFAGCHRCDLVEAELRQKDNELRDLKARLQQSERMSQAIEHECVGPAVGIAAKPTLPPGFPTYSLRQIVLGRQTGGYDGDDCHGDRALQVVLEPRDIDDQAVKAPGSLGVEVFQISPEGLKAPLSAWEFPADQLRRTWKQGFLSSGYYLVLPWKNWPVTNRLRVVARFTAADGRVFEADKDITIRLASSRRDPGVISTPPRPIPMESEVPLPAPTPLPVAPASGTPRPSAAPSRPVELLRPALDP